MEREREKKHNVNQFSSRCHRNRLRLHRANRESAVHYMTSRYTSLHFITSHFITLHYVTLNFITFHYVMLHSITRCYVTHFITLHGIHSADKSLTKWNFNTNAFMSHITTDRQTRQTTFPVPSIPRTLVCRKRMCRNRKSAERVSQPCQHRAPYTNGYAVHTENTGSVRFGGPAAILQS